VSGFSHNAVLFVALMTSAAAATDAQENSSEKSRGAFGVRLQPFSSDDISTGMQRAEAIRVAYYAPRAQSVAPPIRAESAAESSDVPPPIVSSGTRPMISGRRAVLRNGIAYAPSRAPENVKNAIWAANTLRRKPYVWGGGHGSFNDRGYDCSGTVSFALHYAGLLGTPMPSSDFCRYGARGRGRWITIYSRRGHTFAVIAGLRLDTTNLRYGGDVGPRWYAEGRDTGGFEARHPIGL
jgi:cell wall-associated NlpC family hydrolase